MNRQQQEEAYEVARLAAMVGGQLKVVDQLRDGSGMPANRIDLNSFVAAAKGHNVRQQGGATPVDSMQRKAMEDAMREAMMVPDAPSWKPPVADISSQMIPLPNVQPSSNTTEPAKYIGNELSETIIRLENNVEKIGKTLEILLELIQTTLNHNE